MKRRRNVIILAVVLVVLLLLYVGLRFWNQRSAEKEEAGDIRLVTADDFSAMGYSDDEQAVSFTYKNGAWTYDPDPEIAMQQSEMQTIETDIQGLSATRELDDPDPLADYGLTEPSYSIWYTAGGTTSTIYIGDMVGEDEYYATVDETEKVYTISGDILMDMHFNLIEIAELDDVPAIGSGNLLKVEIASPKETVTYTEESDLESLAGGFGALTLSNVENYDATEDAFAEYGLDPENRTTVTATYTDNDTGEEKTFSIYLGNSETIDDEAYRYLTVQDSHIVYNVTQSVINNMTTVSETEEDEGDES